MTNWRRVTAAGALLGAVLPMLGGCGDDSNPTDGGGDGGPTATPPVEWHGVWVTEEQENGDGKALGGESADTVSVCGDFDFTVLFNSALFNDTPVNCAIERETNCSASWTADTFTYDCSSTGSITCDTGKPGSVTCDFAWMVSGVGTRTGDEFVFDQSLSVDYTGDDCPSDTTWTIRTIGRRIAITPDLSDCPGSSEFDDGTGPDPSDSNTLSFDVTGGPSDIEFVAIRGAVLGRAPDVAGGYVLAAAYSETQPVRVVNITFTIPPIESVPTALEMETDFVADKIFLSYSEATTSGAGSLIGSGSMTITTASADRVAGTFEFSGDLVGLVTGPRSATNGSFDVYAEPTR